MSILNVEHLSHGFGDRAIFQDVSFRLLKGEHGRVGEARACRLSGPAYCAGKGHDHPRCVKERICVSV